MGTMRSWYSRGSDASQFEKVTASSMIVPALAALSAPSMAAMTPALLAASMTVRAASGSVPEPIDTKLRVEFSPSSGIIRTTLEPGKSFTSSSTSMFT